MNYYRLDDDVEKQDRWFLDTVIPESNDEWAFWSLVDASGVAVEKTWKVQISRPGTPLDFTFSGFDVPIVNKKAKDVFDSVCPEDFDSLVVEVEGTKDDYHILNVKNSFSRLDEESSIFDKWTENDGRPEKVGEYRTVTRMKIIKEDIPPNKHLFRLNGWEVAVVVSETLAKALKTTRGLKFINITSQAVLDNDRKRSSSVLIVF